VKEDAPYGRNRLARGGLNSKPSNLAMTDLHPCSKKNQSLKRSFHKCIIRVGSSEIDCSSHIFSQSPTELTSEPRSQHLNVLQKEPDAVWKHRPLPLHCLPMSQSSNPCSLRKTLTYYQSTVNGIMRSN